MSRADMRKSQLDLREHVGSRGAAAATLDDKVVELGLAVGITTYALAFSDVGRLTETKQRSRILSLLMQCQSVSSGRRSFFNPAIRNCLGILSAIIGESGQAAEHFELTMSLVTHDDDKKSLLHNLLIVQLVQRKFDEAIETVQALAKLKDSSEINRVATCSAQLTIAADSHSDSLKGMRFVLDGMLTVIGRTAPGKTESSIERFVELESRLVSRRHARLICEHDRWSIEDLGSRSGTYVNGRRIEGVELVKSGDRFRIGDIDLLFSIPSIDSATTITCDDFPVSESGTVECEASNPFSLPDALPPSVGAAKTIRCDDTWVSETDLVECDASSPPAMPGAMPQSQSAPNTKTPPYRHENVQFTIYRPRSVVPSKWYPLLAFAHLSDNPPEADDPTSPIEQVQQQAAALLGKQVAAFQNTTQDALYAVPHEGELTLVPNMEGVQFNPPSRTFLWQESVHREEFRMMAGAELIGQTARGRLTVFLGNIILADVPLIVNVTRTESTVDSQQMEPQSAVPYRKIFASYSHRDLQIVEQFERYVGVLGDEYVRDWRHLRSGQVWNDQLMKMIREADVFQLFWSSNSMRSPYVRQEWEYALALGRPLFVRPTYWEKPLPNLPAEGLPPESLRRLHFQMLGTISQPANQPVDSSSDNNVDTPAVSAPSRSPEPQKNWHEPVRAMRLSRWERAVRWCRRRPTLSLVFVALVVIVLVLVVALVNWL